MEGLFKVVMMELGFAEEGEEELVEVVVGTATGVGFTVAALLTDIVVRGGEEIDGLEIIDVDFSLTSVTMARVGLLAFPHSASTSAMMSPPPEIESKVRREEMSASKVLRLFSPGNIGGSVVGKGGTCSLDLLTLTAVTWGDGVVAVLSCADEPLAGS